jgi:hypothetical protein
MIRDAAAWATAQGLVGRYAKFLKVSCFVFIVVFLRVVVCFSAPLASIWCPRVGNW